MTEAVSLLEHSRGLIIPSMSFLNAIGSLKLQAGDRQGAEQEFRRSLAIAPQNAGALKGLEEAQAFPSK